MSDAATDLGFMRRAIDLALARMGDTWPNPAVGCVIVKDGLAIAEAATAAGGRVVIAAVDPSPFASGRGVERLRQSGLTVETGLLSEDAGILYEGYLHRLETGRPMVRISEDGAGFDARFAAAPRADLGMELKRLGEAGYTRLWTGPGELADALIEQGLLTA